MQLDELAFQFRSNCLFDYADGRRVALRFSVINPHVAESPSLSLVCSGQSDIERNTNSHVRDLRLVLPARR